jgi:exodeoxyribonuclease VII small subunit
MSSDGHSLEQALSRLEKIVHSLEREDLELDDALRLFEEGLTHVRNAQHVLSTAELKIERLIDERGKAQLEPMPQAGES